MKYKGGCYAKVCPEDYHTIGSKETEVEEKYWIFDEEKGRVVNHFDEELGLRVTEVRRDNLMAFEFLKPSSPNRSAVFCYECVPTPCLNP